MSFSSLNELRNLEFIGYWKGSFFPTDLLEVWKFCIETEETPINGKWVKKNLQTPE